MDRYYQQELLRRLQYLVSQFEAEGRSTKILLDAIAFISRGTNG